MEAKNEEIRFPNLGFRFDMFDAKKGRKDWLWLHHHDALEINIVLDGQGINYIEDTAYPMSRGDFFLFNPLVDHMALSDGTLEMKVLLFEKDLVFNGNPENYALIQPFYGSMKSFRHSLSQDDFENVADLVKKMQIAWDHSEGDFWLIRSQLVYLLALIRANSISWAEAANPRELEAYNRIRSSIRMMYEEYQDQLSLDQIASCSNMSASYFCSFFKKVMNMSTFEYLSIVRINRACIMLRTSERPIVDICLDCGFDNLSNFNHAFKKIIGVSPRDYRKRGDKKTSIE